MEDWKICVLFGQQQPAANNGDPFGGILGMLMPLIMLVFLYVVIIQRPQKREQLAREAMLKALKRNDHVVTTGGIFGVVTNVNADSQEVTLKVDETTNTKLRLTLSAISRVISSSGDEEKTA